MASSMKVRLRDFKSVGSAEMELAPLTLLLGPPASGKSNLLDALAFAGYFNRFLLLDEEYGGRASHLEPPIILFRFSEHDQLFRHHDLAREIRVEIGKGEKRVAYGVSFKAGRISIEVNGVGVPWDMKSLPPDPAQGIRAIRASLKEAAMDLVDSRLYGYDRYGLARSTCQSLTECGFHLYLKQEKGLAYPRSLMSELGWNARLLTKTVTDVVVDINDVLAEYLGEKVEVKVLRSGSTTIFDYHYEVDSQAVSDSIFRALYYLMALRTATNYIKAHGLEGRFILMMEDPEAHLFPFFMDLLARYVARATELAYVVMTTHNPILVSILWDKVKDTRTYYVYRGEDGSTSVREVDVRKLAERMKTVEELLFMPPREVLEEFVAYWRSEQEQ